MLTSIPWKQENGSHSLKPLLVLHGSLTTWTQKITKRTECVIDTKYLFPTKHLFLIVHERNIILIISVYDTLNRHLKIHVYF